MIASKEAFRRISNAKEIAQEIVTSKVPAVFYYATKGGDMSFNPTYQITPDTKKELVAYTAGWVKKAKSEDNGFIKQDDVDEAVSRLDTKRLLSDRPQSMTEEDVIGVYKLAALTEIATDIYAPAFLTAAKIHGQEDWLSWFMEDVWKPDEYGHAAPFVEALYKMDAVSQWKFNQELKDAKEAIFDYGAGYTPKMTTDFGIIQEDLTDHFHGLIGNMARGQVLPGLYDHDERLRENPNEPFAQIVLDVKARETIHRKIYTVFSLLQFRDNPQSVGQSAQVYAKFGLPGNIVAPEYQKHATRWVAAMGADIPMLTTNIIRHVAETVDNDPVTAGRLAINTMARKGDRVAHVPAILVKGVMDMLGDRLYRMVGEGIFESAKIKLRDEYKMPLNSEFVQKYIEKPIKQQIDHSLRTSNIFGGAGAEEPSELLQAA